MTENRPFHGGDLAAARTAGSGWRGSWIDLSTGINPWPFPIPDLSAEVWQRLPDSGLLRSTLEAARRRYGAPADAAIVAAPGSQALIQWLPRLRRRGRVAVCGPTYGEHAFCWRDAGHDVVETAEPLAAIDDVDVVVVTNPNNPDGRITPASVLREAAGRLAARGGWLVVDEAFADLDPDISLAGAAASPGLAILRSTGKFFGLAGLRLGFLLAPEDIAAAVERALGPWAVGGPALAVGAAALADGEWIATTRSRLRAAAKALSEDLAALGLREVGGTDLFRLVADDRASALFDALLRNGILVRRFPDRPSWLRLGLPAGEAERSRLAETCGAFVDAG
jgi:cobalamin biosynthetic protein CobC